MFWIWTNTSQGFHTLQYHRVCQEEINVVQRCEGSGWLLGHTTVLWKQICMHAARTTQLLTKTNASHRAAACGFPRSLAQMSLWTLNPAARRHRIFWKSFLQPLLSFTLPANEASLKKLHFVTPVNQTFQVLIAMFHVLIWSASEMWQFWWDMEGHRGEGWVFSFSLVWTDLITLGSKNSALMNTQIQGSKTRCDPTAEPRISYTMVTKAVTLSPKKLCIQTKQSTKVMNTKFQFGSQHK